MTEENSQPSEPQQTEKEERVDELDIVGGLLIKLAKSFVAFYRNFFKSQQQS